ncbi:MAG: hypothetical protein NVSMB17_06940 [Candidatus Dormibacteria bacterium]
MEKVETPGPTGILACAAEDGKRIELMEDAIAAAAQSGGRLVLYDLDSASSLVNPWPECEAPRYQHPLSPNELRGLGRLELANQVELARKRGVQAYGWLPSRGDGAEMVEYATTNGLGRIMLSSSVAGKQLGVEVNRLAPGLGVQVEYDSRYDQPARAEGLNSHLAARKASRIPTLPTALAVLAFMAAGALALAVLYAGVLPLAALLWVPLPVGLGAFFLFAGHQRSESKSRETPDHEVK